MRIGIDFDNTITDYDLVIDDIAQRWGLVDPEVPSGRLAVRDHLRASGPEGERSWQRIQGYIYGKGMPKAVPIAGFKTFLRRANAAGHTVVIISHKTEFGHFDDDRVDLREMARDWLTANGFFSPGELCVDQANVWFEPTQREKIDRIAEVNVDCFIDDLPEIFLDSAFPEDVSGILIGGTPEKSSRFQVFPTWQEITRHLFNEP